jgi:hypothetical protein
MALGRAYSESRGTINAAFSDYDMLSLARPKRFIKKEFAKAPVQEGNGIGKGMYMNIGLGSKPQQGQ